MSEFTDLLLRATSPIVAVSLLGLGAGEVFLWRFFRSRFDDVEDDISEVGDDLGERIGRIEDRMIATDGGEPRDDE